MSNGQGNPTRSNTPVDSKPGLLLRLFVAGEEHNSRLALINLHRLCREKLSRDCRIEVVDVFEAGGQARAEGIRVAPALLVESGGGRLILTGCLDETDKATAALFDVGMEIAGETPKLSRKKPEERPEVAGTVLESILSGCVDAVIGDCGLRLLRRVEQEKSEKSALENMEKMIQKRTVELVKFNEVLREEISERRKTEAALRKSEALLAEAQGIARLGSWQWSLHDNSIEWSDTIYEIFGVETGAPVTYDFFLERVHPADRERVDRAVRDALEKKAPYSVDHRIVLTDLSEKIVHEEGKVWFDSTDKPFRMVGTVQDITRLKKTEQNLVKEREKLQQMLDYQSLQAEVAQCLNSGESFHEVAGTVLRRICSALRVDAAWFYRQEEPEGGPLSLFQYFDCRNEAEQRAGFDVSDGVLGLIGRLRSGRICRLSSHSSSDREIMARFSDAGVRALIGCSLSISGEVHGYLCFGRRKIKNWTPTEAEVLRTLSDMFAGAWEREQQIQGRLEAQRKQTEAVRLAEQASRLASIGVLAGGIIHEINQPLNALSLVTESLIGEIRDRGRLPESELLDHLDTIAGQVRRIGEIVTHMRTFWVKPEQATVSQFDLNEAVKYALGLVHTKLRERGVTLLESLDGAPLMLSGDRIHLEQIVLNLVVNAMQALDESGRTDKQIQVKASPYAGLAALEVQDNGPGFKASDRDRLFDPFYSSRPPGEGTGLGLAIVKKFVQEFGGGIEAELNDSGGATFRLEFPLYTPSRK